jgi:hypothetical protein
VVIARCNGDFVSPLHVGLMLLNILPWFWDGYDIVVTLAAALNRWPWLHRSYHKMVEAVLNLQ